MVHAAGTLLYRLIDGKPVYLLLHATSHGEWGFPKGHAEAGESLWATALRETSEECGIGLLAADGWHRDLSYRVGDQQKTVRYFGARTAQDQVRLSSEHDQHRWGSVMELIGLICHPDLRDLLAAHEATRLA